MQAADILKLSDQILWAGFFVSVLFGAIAQRTHFCTMGAISDVVHMDDWTRMRQWVLAVGVAMLGFGALVYFGYLDPAKTLYSANRWIWLSAAAGGALFGFGMVLASGCGSKTLVRIGAGNLKSLVVFLVLGLSAFATLKGVTAVLRVETVDGVAVSVASGVSLPQILAPVFSVQLRQMSLLLGGILGGALFIWALAAREFRSFDNLLAGLGIGGLVVLAWWISGTWGYVAEHPETLQETFLATNSGRAESLSFVAPVAYAVDWLLFFSDKSKVLTLGIVSVAGVVVGSGFHAVFSKTFRWEGFGGTEDLANHLVGAALMGIGGVTAMGCTIGQGLSGISTLSLTSFVALVAIMAGALAAFKYQAWRVEQML